MLRTQGQHLQLAGAQADSCPTNSALGHIEQPTMSTTVDTLPRRWTHGAATGDGGPCDPARLFDDRLSHRLGVEYEALLSPFGSGQLVPALIAGRFFRTRLAHHIAGRCTDALVEKCAAFEMLHTSTLVHDDIIDRSDLRRNHPTLWKSVGPDHALLLGNLIASRAFMLASSGRRPMTDAYLDAYWRVNVAQERELVLRGRLDKTGDEYFDICRGKTSAMFELAFLVGATSTDDNCGYVDCVPAVHEIGLAFQIIDDVEDVTNWLHRDRHARSKSGAFDIELGNYTLPVLLASTTVRRGQAAPGGDLLDHIDDETWSDALVRSLLEADRHMEEAEQIMAAVRDRTNGKSGVVERLSLWIDQVVLVARTKPLDSVVTVDAR